MQVEEGDTCTERSWNLRTVGTKWFTNADEAVEFLFKDVCQDRIK